MGRGSIKVIQWACVVIVALEFYPGITVVPAVKYFVPFILGAGATR